jgi:AcrR family transcriptional regulator
MTETANTAPDIPRRTLRKQREKEQRVASILQAAETLFAGKGYLQTGIEEIADAAEVSTGTIYFYFKNKEDLLIRLMADCAYVLRKALGAGLEKSGYSFEGFCRVGQSFLNDFCLRYPEKTTILFRESVGQGPQVEEARKQLFERVTDDLKRGLQVSGRGEDGSAIPDPLAEFIAVAAVGIYAQAANHYLIWRDDPGDISPIAEQTVSFLLGGIAGLLAPSPAETKRKGASKRDR